MCGFYHILAYFFIENLDYKYPKNIPLIKKKGEFFYYVEEF